MRYLPFLDIVLNIEVKLQVKSYYYIEGAYIHYKMLRVVIRKLNLR